MVSKFSLGRLISKDGHNNYHPHMLSCNVTLLVLPHQQIKSILPPSKPPKKSRQDVCDCSDQQDTAQVML